MEQKLIYTAINAAMKDITAIGKEKQNKQQGFMFRGIDDVMNELKPVLDAHGIFIVPEVLDTQREDRISKSGTTMIYTIHKIKFHFTATDGSEVCATVMGEGMDMADKSSNKAMAIAFKYACLQVFCIPTEDLAADDPDAYSPEESIKAQPAPQPKPQPTPEQRRQNAIAWLAKQPEAVIQDAMAKHNVIDLNLVTLEVATKLYNYIQSIYNQNK